MKSIHHLLKAFKPFYLDDAIEPSLIGSKYYPLPKFSKECLYQLMKVTNERLKAQPGLLKLEGDYAVVGDIHGNFKDLVRILRRCGNPEDTKYLFLGDYVDRGEYSLEVLELLFALTVIYPDNIYLLRGNHEFEEVNTQYGFKKEFIDLYEDEELYKQVITCFSYLPLAARINRTTFCVHGGISERIDNINEINSIPRPFETYGPSVPMLAAADMMWGDPDVNIEFYRKSERGGGNCYGCLAIEAFLTANKLSRVVRGHQMVNGVEMLMKSMLITVFSSSNYKPVLPNDMGVLIVTSDQKIQPIIMPPIGRSKRENSVFIFVNTEPKQEQLISLKFFGKPQFKSRARFNIATITPSKTMSSIITKSTSSFKISTPAATQRHKCNSPLPLSKRNRHSAMLPALPQLSQSLGKKSGFDDIEGKNFDNADDINRFLESSKSIMVEEEGNEEEEIKCDDSDEEIEIEKDDIIGETLRISC